jgi:hypothetical protein
MEARPFGHADVHILDSAYLQTHRSNGLALMESRDDLPPSERSRSHGMQRRPSTERTIFVSLTFHFCSVSHTFQCLIVYLSIAICSSDDQFLLDRRCFPIITIPSETSS